MKMDFEYLEISPQEEQAAKESQRLKCEQDLKEFTTAESLWNSTVNFQNPSLTNSSPWTYCAPNFDGRLCWSKAFAGTEVTAQCPQYIDGFLNDTNGKLTLARKCNSEGVWEWLQDRDYTFCGELFIEWNSVIQWLTSHLDRVAWIYTVGYCVCLGPLLASVFVLMAFRRLRCPRNYIHVNFFISVICQFITSLIKDLLSPSKWITADNPDIWRLIGCRSFFVSSYYFSSATCAWTFVEGLYLYILMFSTTAVEQNLWKKLMAVGWGAPFVFVLAWGLCRYFINNTGCWSSHYQNSYVFYVLKLPNVGMISCTFFFFIRIFITLIHKLRADSNARRPTGIATRMVKSTLALIVLFGVPYITFAFMPDNEIPFTRLNLIKWHKALVLKLYFEFTFQVVQALALVALFAFGNNEVQEELSYLFSRLRHRIFGGNLPQHSQSRTRASTVNSKYNHSEMPVSEYNGNPAPVPENATLLESMAEERQPENVDLKELEETRC